MEIELIKLVSIGAPSMFFAVVTYVYLLLGFARKLSGALKLIAGMLLYLVFAVVSVSPLFYLLSENQPGIQESTYELIAVLLAYALIMAPGMYYLGKVKIKELQRAGYFLPQR